MTDKKQRMVYLSDAAIPSRAANSIQTMKMCEAFAEHGLAVTLIVPDRPTEESGDPYAFYDVEECFEIVRVPWKPGERYLYSLLAPYYVRQVDPDIVYGRFIPACFFTSLLKYRVIVESHTPVSESQRIIAWMFRTMLRLGQLDHLVVISEALQDHYLETYDGLSETDVTVAHDAASKPPDVDPLPFAESERLQVGYVGHLYEGKGISLIADLIPRCPWADFHIVGGTDEDIAYWKAELKEYENVEFHGFVPPQEVARYQQSMDVLLAPYQSNVYGSSGETDLSQWMSPLKIFEYMSAGKLIMCSDLNVLREVVGEDCAIICDPSRPNRWADYISDVNDGKINTNAKSAEAKKRYEENFTYNCRSLKILNSLIG